MSSKLKIIKPKQRRGFHIQYENFAKEYNWRENAIKFAKKLLHD